MVGILSLWAVLQGAGEEPDPPGYAIQCLSEDGRYIAVAPVLPHPGLAQSVLLWDVALKKPIAEVPGREKRVGMRVYKIWPDGRALVSDGSRLFIWDPSRRTAVLRIEGFRWIMTADISPDERTIALSRWFAHSWGIIKKPVEFWRSASPPELLGFLGGSALDGTALRFSPRGDKVAVLAAGGRLVLAEAPAGKVLHELPVKSWGGFLCPIEFLPRGEGILLTGVGPSHREAWILDLEKGEKRVFQGPSPSLIMHPGEGE